jgi:hypothetical protein
MEQVTQFKKLGRIRLAQLILLPCVVLLMGADSGCPSGTGPSAPNATCETPVTVKLARGTCAPVPAGRCVSGSTELNNVEYDFQTSGLPPGITLQTGGPFADFPQWSGVEVCATLDAPVSPFPFNTPVVTIPYTGTSGGAWGTGSVDVIVYSPESIGSPGGLSATLSGPSYLSVPTLAFLNLSVVGCGNGGTFGYCSIHWSDGFDTLNRDESVTLTHLFEVNYSTTYSAEVVLNNADGPFLSTTATHTILVGSPSPLSASVTAFPESIRQGDWSQLKATVSGGFPGYSFSWSPPVGLSDPGISDPVAKPNQTTKYTLTVTDAANRTISKNVTVYVAPDPPSVSIYVDPATVPVGPGLSTQLKALVIGGAAPFTYSWTPSNTLVAANIWNPVATPPVTTTYTVTVTDSNGLLATASVRINVSLIVSASATPNIVQWGDSSQLNAVASGGSPPYSYSWIPAAGLANASIVNPRANPNNNSQYVVTVTDAAGNSATSIPVGINVRIYVTASATPAIITQGGVSQLKAIVWGGGVPSYSFSWTPTAGLLSGASTATALAGPLTTTNYTVTATDSIGEYSSATTTVTVVPAGALTACFKVSGMLVSALLTLDASCSTGRAASWLWNLSWLDYLGNTDQLVFSSPSPTTQVNPATLTPPLFAPGAPAGATSVLSITLTVTDAAHTQSATTHQGLLISNGSALAACFVVSNPIVSSPLKLDATCSTGGAVSWQWSIAWTDYTGAAQQTGFTSSSAFTQFSLATLTPPLFAPGATVGTVSPINVTLIVSDAANTQSSPSTQKAFIFNY